MTYVLLGIDKVSLFFFRNQVGVAALIDKNSEGGGSLQQKWFTNGLSYITNKNTRFRTYPKDLLRIITKVALLLSLP